MSKDILGMYGPDSSQPQVASMKKNGPVECKSLPYDPPKGPSNMMHKGPGLADSTNHGCCGTQGTR